jgi:hypothetical protein
MPRDKNILAEQAGRAMHDPVLMEAFDNIERDIVDALCKIPMTGGDDCHALVLEKVRDLQANRRAQQKLWAMAGYGKLNVERPQPMRNAFRDPRWIGE